MADNDKLETLSRLLEPWQGKAGALLPALWAVQDELGYIPADGVAQIADRLNLSIAEVHGVISFYHDFKTTPPARHSVKMCRAEACQAMGARALQAQARQLLAAEFDQPSSSASVALESVYCLGLCACAPAAMIDGSLHGRLDATALTGLLSALIDAEPDSA